MAKAVTVNQIRNVPFALALAFACAWMLDPSATIPAGFASLVSFSQYSHLLVTSLAFGVLALFHRQTSTFLSSKAFVVASCSLCFLGFFGAWACSLQPETFQGVLPFACLCVTALCRASLLISCLKALAGLPLVDCLLTLIAWQFFVGILRALSTLLPPLAISCIAPLAIALCLTRKTSIALWRENPTATSPSEEAGKIEPRSFFPIARLLLIYSLIIFTIQTLQGFAPTPVASVSYFGLFIAIAVTSIALAVNGRIVRIKQLYDASLAILELAIIVFAIGAGCSYEIASILLDASYMTFSTFFFTILCNLCQRRGNNPVFVFSLAYLAEQLAAFLGEAFSGMIGPGVHALPLVLLAGLGAIAFVYLSPLRDGSLERSADPAKAQYVDPARYYTILAETCTSVAMQCSLTKREGDVLLLLAQRKTLAQISDDLVVGLATVKTHTHNIYKKLGVHSKQELYQFLGLENLSYSAKSSTKPTR